MLEAKEKVIDGVSYKVHQLGARKALRMLQRIIKIVGPGIATGIQGVDGQGGFQAMAEMDIGKLALGQAVKELADRLDEAVVDGIVDELAQVTVVVKGDKQPALSAIFDLHFAGKMKQLFQWLLFALEVQFGDFFGGPGGISAGVGSLLQSSEAPSPHPPSSG